MPTTTQTLCYNCFQHIQDPAAPCPHCGFDLGVLEEALARSQELARQMARSGDLEGRKK